MQKFSNLEAIEVFLRLILFFLRDCVKMFRSIADLLGSRKIFSAMNVKSRRGFAVSAKRKKFDGSVNLGGKN